MRHLGWLVLVAFLPLRASAQTTDPSLLVLDPVGVPDASVASQLTASISEVGRTLGYHVLTPAAGSAVGTLDPSAGATLLGVATRSGVHRALVVWVLPASAGYDVQVGLASSDATTVSLRASASASSLVDTATRLCAALLPAPFATPSGAWGTSAVIAPAASVAPPPTTTYAPVTVSSTSPPPATERPSRRGEIGFLVGGAVSLGAGWIFNFIIGLFGGYHDRTCWFGSCPSGTSWDPAWDDFRASSLVPIIGPWIQLAVKPASDDGWPEFLIIDGIVQGVGAILMFVGIGLFVDSDHEPPPVAVLPWIGPGLAGLTTTGRF